jgi:hypothetical protein
MFAFLKSMPISICFEEIQMEISKREPHALDGDAERQDAMGDADEGGASGAGGVNRSYLDAEIEPMALAGIRGVRSLIRKRELREQPHHVNRERSNQLETPNGGKLNVLLVMRMSREISDFDIRHA